ncbi:MAG: hypothetical protein ACREQV_08215, partial [Candidatus Binatia bacterium]
MIRYFAFAALLVVAVVATAVLWPVATETDSDIRYWTSRGIPAEQAESNAKACHARNKLMDLGFTAREASDYLTARLNAR